MLNLNMGYYVELHIHDRFLIIVTIWVIKSIMKKVVRNQYLIYTHLVRI